MGTGRPRSLTSGKVAVVTLAGGAGSRWTRGAGVVKALHPFAQFGGRHRNFLEVHLAKTLRRSNLSGTDIPHVATTSYLTQQPIETWLQESGINLASISRTLCWPSDSAHD